MTKRRISCILFGRLHIAASIANATDLRGIRVRGLPRLIMAASRHNLVRLRRTATLVQTDGTLVEGDELVHWSLAIHPLSSLQALCRPMPFFAA